MLLYRSLRLCFRGIFKVVYRWEISGLENVPAEGGLVLCCNHTSNWDPPFVGSPLKRMLSFMAKEELFRVPIFGSIIKRLGAFPVKRGGVSKESIKLSIRILQQGGAMVVFPEGSRSNAGGMGKKGAAMLAMKSGATVIPAAIVGGYRPFRKTSVIYGKPVDLSEFAEMGSDGLEAATDKIMQAIRKLADEKKSKNQID